MYGREAVLTEQVGEYLVEVFQDELDFNPREEYDNASTMLCVHGQYNLGDEVEGFPGPDAFSSWDEIEDWIESEFSPVFIAPLYLLDHSGITISMRDFADPWDSGQVGFVFITPEQVTERIGYSLAEYTPEQAAALAAAEVREYDQYLRGEVYGYTVSKVTTCSEGEEHMTMEDSCWGFIGSADDALEAGLESVPEAEAGSNRASLARTARAGRQRRDRAEREAAAWRLVVSEWFSDDEPISGGDLVEFIGALIARLENGETI